MADYEECPLVQMTPADMATVHGVLTKRAAACAETEAVYRREAARIAAVKAPPEEVKERAAGRLRAHAEHVRRADLLKAEAAELERIAQMFAALDAGARP